MSTHTIHGIDLYAPGGVEALLAFHRSTFGDLLMEAGGGDPSGAEAPGGGASTTPEGTEDGGKADPPTKVRLDGEFDPDRMARALEAARGDANREKGKRTAAETQLQTIARLLGGEDGEKPDPAKLAGQLTAAQDAHRQARTELATYRRATKAGADPDALLDSRAYLTAVAGLDPDSATFLDDVDAAIRSAVKGNDRLKVSESTTAPRAGVPLQGGPEGKPGKPASLAEAITSRLGN